MGSAVPALSAPPRAPALTQLVLDVGQRDVEHRACSLCGMVYGHGLSDDEATHARWCQATRATARGGAEQPLLALSGWRAAGRVVEAAQLEAADAPPPPRADRADIRRHFGSALAAPTACDAVYVAALPDTPAAARAPAPRLSFSVIHVPWAAAGAAPVLAPVQRLLDAELGDAACPVRRLRGGGEGGPPAPDVHYFLALAPGDVVVGAVVTERVSTGFRVRVAAAPPSAASPASVDPDAGHGPVPPRAGDGSGNTASLPPPQPFSAPQALRSALHLDEPVRAVLGVAQVWVAPAHRRRGVARALLSAAAAHAVYGYAVPSDEVAFSQTTAAGARLAAAYAGRPDFCVYL